MTQRYEIDLTGDLEWSIFDPEVRNDPIVHFMYVFKVAHPHFNYQLVLTAYDGVQASLLGHRVFPIELYSTFFYCVDHQLEEFLNSILHSVQSTTIENPIELAYYFGGHVLSSPVRVARLPTIN